MTTSSRLSRLTGNPPTSLTSLMPCLTVSRMVTSSTATSAAEAVAVLAIQIQTTACEIHHLVLKLRLKDDSTVLKSGLSLGSKGRKEIIDNAMFIRGTYVSWGQDQPPFVATY